MIMYCFSLFQMYWFGTLQLEVITLYFLVTALKTSLMFMFVEKDQGSVIEIKESSLI